MQKDQFSEASVLRRRQVERKTGLSRSTIYHRMKEGEFPKPINLGGRSVGWLDSEIDAWLLGQIESRDAGKRGLQ